MRKTDKISWEDAILKVVETSGGVATLKELYQRVPQIRKISSSSDVNHVIRAYLRRMTISGKLKRVGLGMYAFPEIKLERNLFEDIQKGKTKKEMFKDIKDGDLHFCRRYAHRIGQYLWIFNLHIHPHFLMVNLLKK